MLKMFLVLTKTNYNSLFLPHVCTLPVFESTNRAETTKSGGRKSILNPFFFEGEEENALLHTMPSIQSWHSSVGLLPVRVWQATD